ncbi:glutamyl-tRNA amidotransferase [Parcubacteria bacterium DG_74_3]|nr:MAG: glutamyl-tRNA amidotransferase [Parcubacteria bacterium DG_74_3]
MLKKEEVEHIAKLARLGLTEKELEKMKRELSKILDYFEQLKEIDVSRVEPATHSVKVENVMREDEERLKKPKDQNKKLLDLVPERKDNYLKVKSIL